MKQNNLFKLSILLLSALFFLLLFTTMPLGIPGEWVWQRLPFPSEIPVEALAAVFITAAAGFFLAYIIDRKIPGPRWKWKLSGIILLSFCGIFFDYTVQTTGRISVTENYITVGDNWSTGYLTQAANIKDIRTFLADYEENLSIKEKKIIHHNDVHPPGNTVYAYIFLAAMKRFPDTAKKIVHLLTPP